MWKHKVPSYSISTPCLLGGNEDEVSMLDLDFVFEFVLSSTIGVTYLGVLAVLSCVDIPLSLSTLLLCPDYSRLRCIDIVLVCKKKRC